MFKRIRSDSAKTEQARARKQFRKGIHCAHMGVLFLMETACSVCAIRGRAGPTTVWALWTQDNRGLMAAIVPRAHALRSSSKVVGGRVRFYGCAHPLSPNGRMCALDSPLPPFPTNPLSQHRNALCAHGCVFVSFPWTRGIVVCAIRGRARDLLRSGHSGPKTIAASWPQSFPGPALCASTPPPSGPNALLVFTSFTGVSPAPHGAFSLMTRVS